MSRRKKNRKASPKRPAVAVKNAALDVNDDRLYQALSGASRVSTSGITVNESTAMKFSAVYGCVSLLAGCIASLPIQIKTDVNGYDEAIPGARLRPILNRTPNQVMTAFVFWETLGYNLFLSGNSYAIISRTSMGDPKGLIWAPCGSVSPKLNDAKTRLLYQVSVDGKSVTYDQDDILHFPCIGWDGLRGLSPIAAATEGIGLGLAGEKYNSHFFSNAVTSDIAITYDKPMSPDAQKQLEAYLSDRYSNLDNLRKPFIGTNGAKVVNLGMSASDAQMIEARDYQVEDICRFYGVPPWLVGSMKKTTSWGTGLGEQTLGFVKFTLRKHLKRIEQEIDRKLIRRPDRFCKFNLDALLRADIKTRNESYKMALGGNQMPGYLSQNDVRQREGLPPDSDPKSDMLYRPPEPTETAINEQPEQETNEEI